jgi:hypothetical protein
MNMVQIGWLTDIPYVTVRSLIRGWPIPSPTRGPHATFEAGDCQGILVGLLLRRSGLPASCQGLIRAIKWARTADLQAELAKGTRFLVVNSLQCFAAKQDAIFGTDAKRPAVCCVLDLEVVHRQLTDACNAIADNRELAAAN